MSNESDSSERKKNVGRYQLIRAIGSGARGQVYLAHDPLLDSKVALKLLHHAENDADVVRFQNEAIATGKLKHSGIAQTLDFGVADGELYMVMEFFDGDSLSTVLEREKTLPVKRALPLFLDICDALMHAHGNGIFHRDLKPANVIIVKTEASRESAKLVDFGIAKIQGYDHRVTDPDAIVGSPVYMSPEQAKNLPVDGKSDIYSLGCLMYETIAGRPPIVADTAINTIRLKTEQAAKSVKVALADANLEPVPDELAAVVDGCLKTDSRERFQNVSVIAQKLREIELGEDEIVNADEAAPPRKRRALTPPAVVVSALILALVGGAACFGVSTILRLSTESSPVLGSAFKYPYGPQRQSAEPNAETEAELEREPQSRLNGNGAGRIGSSFMLDMQEEMGSSPILGNERAIELTPKGHPNSAKVSRLATDDDLKKLQGLPIQCVVFEHAGLLRGDGFRYLEKLPLTRIAMYQTNVRDTALKSLSKIKSLQRIEIYDAPHLTDVGMSYLRDCPNLDCVDLIFRSLTNKGVSYLAAIPKLNRLVIYQARHVNDDSIPALARAHDVFYLNIGFTSITAKGIAELLRQNKSIGALNMDGIQLSEETIDALSRSRLEELHIEDSGITVLQLKKLCAMTTLKTLSIDGRKLDAASVAELKRLRLDKICFRDLTVDREMLQALSTLDPKWFELSHSKVYKEQLATFLKFRRLEMIKLSDVDGALVPKTAMDAFAVSYKNRWGHAIETNYDSEYLEPSEQ